MSSTQEGGRTLLYPSCVCHGLDVASASVWGEFRSQFVPALLATHAGRRGFMVTSTAQALMLCLPVVLFTMNFHDAGSEPRAWTLLVRQVFWVVSGMFSRLVMKFFAGSSLSDFKSKRQHLVCDRPVAYRLWRPGLQVMVINAAGSAFLANTTVKICFLWKFHPVPSRFEQGFL